MKASSSPKNKLAQLFEQDQSSQPAHSPLPRNLKYERQDYLPRQSSMEMTRPENFLALEKQLSNIKFQVYRLINQSPNSMLQEKQKKILLEEPKEDGTNKTIKKVYKFMDNRRRSIESDQNQEEYGKEGKKTLGKSRVTYRKSVDQFKQITSCRNCYKYKEAYQKYQLLITENKQIKSQMAKTRVEFKAKIEFLSKENIKLTESLDSKILQIQKKVRQAHQIQQICENLKAQLKNLTNDISKKDNELMQLIENKSVENLVMDPLSKDEHDVRVNSLRYKSMGKDFLYLQEKKRKQKIAAQKFTERSRTPAILEKSNKKILETKKLLKQIDQLKRQLLKRQARDRKNKTLEIQHKTLSQNYSISLKRIDQLEQLLDEMNKRTLLFHASILNQKYAALVQ